MSLTLAHERLGWPSPQEVRNPSGEGAQVFAKLAQAKIERTISRYPDASSVKVGVLLRNSQAKDTEAPLAIVAEFDSKVSDQTLRALHRLAWNFSHSPTVVTVEPDLLRVWTCCEPPENRPLLDYVVQELSTAVLAESHPTDISDRATHVLHWVNLVSGQFFKDHSERFRRDQRADQMLLGNLRHVRLVLHKQGLNNDDVCHDLLARIVFVQFLFDRKDPQGNSALNQTKLASLCETGILQKEHKDFSSLLDDYDETYRLFDWLNGKFNGDLFPGKGNTHQERARGWKQEKEYVKTPHLRLLRDFIRGDLDMPSGQLCLWPQYAFDAIPLEFISSIYEAFVSERAPGEGIYYTPPHLVDFILDRVLPWDGKEWNLKILDPACGSGIFLVKAFQRLIYRWRKAHPDQTIRAEKLRGILEKNLFGVDKDPHAVRVASFSLYLAMCDEIDPKYYWSQVSFPAMREHRLINADFFEENRIGFRTKDDAASYDLVIGNAPWGEKVSLTEAAKKWANDETHSWPVANKGIGTLFLPKAAALAKQGGKIAMIQSASSLLFNRGGPAGKFRRKFFTIFRVEEVINLSALRFKVFNRKTHSTQTSVAPSCIMIFRPQPVTNECFPYISPKQTDDLADEFEIVVEPVDVKSLYPDQAANAPEVWSTLLWGNLRDRVLIQRLKHLRNIENCVPSEWTRRGIEFGNRQQPRPDLAERRILLQPDFTTVDLFSLDPATLPKFTEPFIHSKDSTDFTAFSTPQLLIKRSWRTTTNRFQARLISPEPEEGVLCTQSYVTVHLPQNRRNDLEAACLSYNSILAVYFLLLTSSRFSSYRPEPLVSELLRVPIPELRENTFNGLRSFGDVDRRVREAFEFKDAEWVLVEDLFNITLPDFKGVENSPGRRRTQRKVDSLEEPQLRLYCEYFIRVLKAGFGHDKNITATIFQEAGNELLPYRLIAFELNRRSAEQVRVASLHTTDLLNKLEVLNRTWLRNRKTTVSNIYHQRVVRIYEHRDGAPTILILKPDAHRYWTRSIGLHDADEVAADFARWQAATRNE